MNKRLEQFLKAENISQSQFADKIGVARASVSHILAGRNKPGYDFLLNISKHYPSLNLEWLITGKGKMYSGSITAPAAATTLFDDDDTAQIRQKTSTPKDEADTASILQERQTPDAPKATATATTTQNIEHKRNISRIVIFFDDNTYQELK